MSIRVFFRNTLEKKCIENRFWANKVLDTLYFTMKNSALELTIYSQTLQKVQRVDASLHYNLSLAPIYFSRYEHNHGQYSEKSNTSY